MSKDRQDRIVIERREVVGEVNEDYDIPGGTPMVVAAFKLAGEYLNAHAGGSDLDEVMEVEFEYLGVRFIAGYTRQ